ncbi:MAG: amidohydrolase family protein [Candidatus Latescibacterota bacterium]
MELMADLRRFRIVDAHVHNWGLFQELGDLAGYVDRFGLHAVGLLSDLRGEGMPDSSQIEASNEATARAREKIGDRIIPFCYVNATHTEHAVGQVNRWEKEGFRGLKFWISEHATDPRTFSVVEAALGKDWPIFYHSYYRPHGTAPHSESPPMEVAELARRYPQGRFIMAHMGAQFEHGLGAVADCPNVSVDYAGTINEKGAYETALRLLGPDRIVFGTDMPACFYTNAGRVLELEVPDAVKQQIFADNFLKLLKRAP